MNINPPSILVTGGTGFLGRHVVWRLAGMGHDVIFTGRKQTEADIVCARSPRPVRFVPIDHRQESAQETLRQAGQKCQAIVHTAALSSPWAATADFISANVKSTQDVVASCRANGIPKLVHISTPSLYFDFTGRRDIKETSPLPAPVNAYAATKAEAEKIVLASSLTGSIILRPRALFGPWDQTLLPRLLRFLERGFLPVPRSGSALIDITYIDNAVDAVMLALQYPTASPRIYNVSNGTPVAIRDLLDQLLHLFGLKAYQVPVPYALLDGLARLMEATARTKEPLLTRYSAGLLAFDQTLDISAIKQDLGYAPQVGWQEGLARYAAWHKEYNRQ